MNLLERLNKFTPKMCRMVARKKSGWQAMTSADIAKKSGLSKSRVAEIALLESWETIPVGTALKFSEACGVDLLSPGESIRYMKKQKMTHMVNASTVQRKYFAGLLVPTDLPIQRRSRE